MRGSQEQNRPHNTTSPFSSQWPQRIELSHSPRVALSWEQAGVMVCNLPSRAAQKQEKRK